MSKAPDKPTYPLHWEWPLAGVGAVLFGLGFLFVSNAWSFLFFVAGAVPLSMSVFLGWARSQAAFDAAREEVARGQRDYVWRIAFRWLKGRTGR